MHGSTTLAGRAQAQARKGKEMAYQKFFRTLEDAQATAASMREGSWPSARVLSTRQIDPLLAEYADPDDATDTGERWLISVGAGVWVLDGNLVGRAPAA